MIAIPKTLVGDFLGDSLNERENDVTQVIEWQGLYLISL